MHRLRVFIALALLALLSACAGNTRPGARPGASDRITLAEIQESAGRNAYEVAQRLRPGWLAQRRDSRGALLTLVLYNGTRYGYVESLRDLPAEMIGSMQFSQRSAAQDLLTSNDINVSAVIQVFSRGVAAVHAADEAEVSIETPTGLSLTVFPIGYGTTSRSSLERDQYQADGWTETERTSPSPRSVMAAAELRIGEASFGLVAARRLGSDQESYERNSGSVHHWHTSTTAAAVFGYDLGPVRLGVGPALQISNVRFQGGECKCIGGSSTTMYVGGAVAEAVADVRFLGMGAAELRVQRFAFRPYAAQTFMHTPEYGPSRSGWYVGVGAGIRLGR